MKTAVTFDQESGQIFQHFGHCEYFKVYVTEGDEILSSEVVSAAGSGHGALAGFLRELGIQTLICGGIGAGARNALAESGIRFLPGVKGDADEAVRSFLAGTLSYNPNTVCSHHHHEEGHDCGSHTCGEDKHGCGGNR